jgi:hypothetical protein
MIHRAEHLLRVTNLPTCGFESLKRDAAGTLVQKYAICVEQAGAVTQIHYLMFVPDFFDNRQ